MSGSRRPGKTSLLVAHAAPLWRQLRRSERVLLAGVAGGGSPSSPALAAEHGLGRTTLHEAAERPADQGRIDRERGTGVVDPLLAEWLRRR